MEKIDKAIEILQAFKEGKCLEYKINSGTWCDWTGVPTHLFTNGYEYRIKPQQTYRPYANTEEFLKASKEHGPFIVRKTTVIPDVSNSYVTFDNYVAIAFSNEKVNVEFQKYTYKDLFSMSQNNYIFWYDGTPCGILEQQYYENTD